MVERLNTLALKARVGNTTGGSNPSPSALFRYAAPYYVQYVFMLNGHDVVVPAPHATYDLLIYINDQYRRIQIKTSTAIQSSGHYQFQLRRSRSNVSGHSFRFYTKTDCDDILLIDIEHHMWLIPIEAVLDKGMITPHRDYSMYSVVL
jgi:hypothetical protein